MHDPSSRAGRHDAPAAGDASWLPPFDAFHAFESAYEVWSGSRADAAGLGQRAAWRLRDLLEAACASPLQAERLRAAAGPSIGDPARSAHAARLAAAVPLQSIPPIGRAEAMGRFDEACTDREVTLQRVQRFISDAARIGDAFLGRYAVWTSSGTTGTPGIWLHDARALAVYDALESMRFGGLDQPHAPGAGLRGWMHATPVVGGRYAMVGATGGHFAGCASVERLRRLCPWAAGDIRTISIMQPADELVAELNAYAPAIVATYPTAAEMLAAEAQAGRLRIRPREVWLGGEQLTEPVRRGIERALGCRVRETYGASEFMSIAWECGHGSLHVNADWVIVEPVDRDLRPVPPGTASHTVLLTNLANRVQPLVRYDLGDSVTLRATPCPCGAPFPAIRVEGRRDDVLEFDAGDGPVRLLPLALVTVMEDDAGTFDFQLVERDARTLVLRLPVEGEPARAACRQALRTFLDANRLSGVRIVDDPAPPAREPVSGKLRRVRRERRV
jgi:hypothetical protein